MSDEAFVDASPLILLARVGQLELLRLSGNRVWVPPQVMDEISMKDVTDVVAAALARAKWIERHPGVIVPPEISARNLGAGEAAVISAARATSAIAIVDDLQARRCAAALGVRFLGTLGLVLRARHRGLLPEVRPVVEGLLAAGMYLSPGVVAEVLRIAGE